MIPKTVQVLLYLFIFKQTHITPPGNFSQSKNNTFEIEEGDTRTAHGRISSFIRRDCRC